jgi:hypothetical protein
LFSLLHGSLFEFLFNLLSFSFLEEQDALVSVKSLGYAKIYAAQGWKKYRTTGPLVPEKFGVPRKYFTRIKL